MPITPRIFGARGKRRASALGIDPDRLPPGQSPDRQVAGAQPRRQRRAFATSRWQLSIDGAVAAPLCPRLGSSSRRLPQTDWSGDIHCVTRWSKFGMDWRGVSVRELTRSAPRRAAEATHLMAHCYGGYTTNLPLSDVIEHPALIAHTVDGGRWRATTVARPGCWSPTSTCGSRPSGSRGWSCSPRTGSASGRPTAITTGAIRGARSAYSVDDYVAPHDAPHRRAAKPDRPA